MKRAISIEQAGADDANPMMDIQKSGHMLERLRVNNCVAVEQQNIIAPRSLYSLIIRCRKPPILCVFNDLNIRIALTHRSNTAITLKRLSTTQTS